MNLPRGRPSIAIQAATGKDAAQAELLSRELGLPLLPPGTDAGGWVGHDAVLLVGEAGISLQQTRPVGAAGRKSRRLTPPGRAPGQLMPGPVTVDFGSAAMRHRRRAGQNELLGRAVGVSGRPGLEVLDATAGLGRDGFILADMGCVVTLCERQPVIAAMLGRAMQLALASGDAWLEQVVARMRLYAGDARTLAADSIGDTQVIYLDPMFPERDKSAAVKKEMALFQLLLENESAGQDDEELLYWAMQQDVARVVVKRPPRAPSLGGQKPSHQLAGKAVRFDVYVRRALT